MLKAAHDLGVTTGFNNVMGNTNQGGGLLEGLSSSSSSANLMNEMADMTGLSSASPVQANPMSLLAMTGILNCGGGCDCGDSKGEFKAMAQSLIQNVTRLNCSHIAVQTGKGRHIPPTAVSRMSDKIKLSAELHSLLKEVKSMRKSEGHEIVNDNSQTRHSVPMNKTADQIDVVLEGGVVKSKAIKEDNSQTRHEVPITNSKLPHKVKTKNAISRTRKNGRKHKKKKKHSKRNRLKQNWILKISNRVSKLPSKQRTKGGKATRLL